MMVTIPLSTVTQNRESTSNLPDQYFAVFKELLTKMKMKQILKNRLRKDFEDSNGLKTNTQLKKKRKFRYP